MLSFFVGGNTMSYQAKRSKKYIEEFELVNENGEIAYHMEVKLDAAELIKNIHGKYLNLVKALGKVQKYSTEALTHEETPDAIEILGQAMVDMLQVVFGKENADIIVRFYEGRYVEMAQEVFPFFTDVVVPRCDEIIKAQREQIKSKYTRKHRRLFGG